MDNLWLFDRHRIAILQVLAGCREACGCDLKEKLHIKKTLFSYHVALLKKNGFVTEQKCGREKQYAIHPAQTAYVKKILSVIHQ